MNQTRSTLARIALAIATMVCAVLGPRYGGPDPAVVVAVLLSALTSSIAGFAFSAICGAVLFHMCDDQVLVVQTLITCSIANQAAMVCAMRRHVDWRALAVFVAGGAAGLPFGVWALLHADRQRYSEALGLFLLAYSLYTLTSGGRRLRWQHPGLDAAAGFIGGVTGGAAGLPGAPVTMFCRLKGWDKLRQRALFQPFILVMQGGALLLIALVGRTSTGTTAFDPGVLFCVPAGLLGTSIGMACYGRLSNRQFGVAVNLLLIVSGLSFLF